MATLIFAVVVLLFVIRGYFLGFPRVTVRLLALVAGYAATILFTSPGSAWLARETALDGFAPVLVAMVGLFLLMTLLVSILGAVVLYFIRRDEQGRISRASGAGLNGIFGTVVAVVAVWLSAQAHAALYPGESFGDSAIQRFSERAIADLVTRVAERAEPDNPAHARMAGEIASRPTGTLQDLRAFAQSDDLKESLYDPQLQRALLRDDVDAALQTPAWQRLSGNERFRSLMTSSGLARADASRVEQDRAMATELSDLWRRVKAVRGDPDFRAIVDEPGFQKKLNSGNLWAVLSDPRSKELVSLVQNAEPVEPTPKPSGQTKSSGVSESSGEKSDQSQPTEVHKWRDEDGNLHFSDRKRRP